MRLLAYFLWTGFAAAQFSKIPSCAIPCVTQALVISGCSSADLPCMCTSPPQEFLYRVIDCIIPMCRSIEPTVEGLKHACQSYGIHIADSIFDKYRPEQQPPPETSMCMCPCECTAAAEPARFRRMAF
ncbi:hypothetical protein TWF281_010428 [Arthrobotrys megalospora]